MNRAKITAFRRAAITSFFLAAVANAHAQHTSGATLILFNGKVTTLDERKPSVTAIAITGGTITAIGRDEEVMKQRTRRTRVVDLGGRRVIPGLNDSHLHVLRGGLNYALELRWDGVPSLEQALEMVREQAKRTPKGHWVRVVGGWSEFQFRERRLPTLAELNEAAPNVPVFVLHLYDQALLNRAALEALKLTRETKDPPEGDIVRDSAGNPTGLLLAKPSAFILAANLERLPALTREQQLLSTRHFLRELNRFGLTSAMDAGGGGQHYPESYSVAADLARTGQLTLRIAYDLHTQQRGRELSDYQRWSELTRPGQNLDRLRPNGFVMDGAGENIVRLAADFENFREPRPELPATMEDTLSTVVTFLMNKRWPFRIHGTYDESVRRFINVFSAAHEAAVRNGAKGLHGLRWTIDHAETLSDETLRRIRALGGRVAVQSRMAMQAEYFRDRYGAAAAARTPPVRQMLQLGVPVGLGSDGTRVNTYNPWVTLSWIVTGRSVGGYQHLSNAQRLSRHEALLLHTVGSAEIVGEAHQKGRIKVGQQADIAVLSEDFFTVDESRIAGIESVLTIVDGIIVYAAGDYKALNPQLPKLQPAWSPVVHFGGYGAPLHAAQRRLQSNQNSTKDK